MKNEKELFNGFLIYTILWLQIVSSVCKIPRAKSEDTLYKHEGKGVMSTLKEKNEKA